MNKRMLVALVALAGVFVASYLTLYKLGYIGTLACAVGSCETVQTSKWATFLGVTAFGLVFSLWLTYLELFVIHAICQWCVVSAILATILFIVSWLDLREITHLAEETAEEAAERLRDGRFGKELRNTSEVALRAIRKE